MGCLSVGKNRPLSLISQAEVVSLGHDIVGMDAKVSSLQATLYKLLNLKLLKRPRQTLEASLCDGLELEENSAHSKSFLSDISAFENIGKSLNLRKLKFMLSMHSKNKLIMPL